MKKFTQIVGLAGGFLCGLGGLIFGIQQRLGMVASIHLAVGSVLVVFGLLANLGEIKESLKRQTLRIGPQAFFQGGLILVILFFLNILVFRHDVMKDFTYHRLYSLQPATREVMKNLPGKVEVIAFFPGGGPPEARQRLELYAKQFPQVVNFRLVDPDKNEALARAENIPPEPGIKFKYQGKSHWITRYEEGDITNAFIIVTRTTQPRVWFTTGHGEPSLDAPPADHSGLSQLKQALSDQGMETKTIDLATLSEIPPAVTVVAIIGPATAFTEYEVQLLEKYLEQGGNAFIALDPVFDPAHASLLEPFLQKFGLQVQDDLVFEPTQRMARDETGVWVVATELPDHEITQSLTQPRVVFYLSRSLEEMDSVRHEIFLRPLVRTSTESYKKKIDVQAFAQLKTTADKDQFLKKLIGGGPDESAIKGFSNLAYAISRLYPVPEFKKKLGVAVDQEARLVVTGTSTLCRNLAFGHPYNFEFVLASINWLAGEKNLMGIKSPQRKGSRLDLDEKKKEAILMTLIFLPEVFAILGLAVWWRRR